MKTAEVLKGMMKNKRMTQSDVAEKIGKGQNSVSMYLKNADSMRLDNLMKMADACGYDVVLVDRSGSGENYVLGENDGTVEHVQDKREESGMEEMIRRMVREEIAKRAETWTDPRNVRI